MSERQRHTAFLKELMIRADGEEQRRLRERIHKAEHDEKCLWRAVRLMVFIGLLSLVALGHLAVLLPDFFTHSTHILYRIVAVVALGSGICFIFFLGYWLWHRALLNHTREECRRLILQAERTPALSNLSETFRPSAVSEGHSFSSQNETPNPLEEDRLHRLRNAR